MRRVGVYAMACEIHVLKKRREDAFALPKLREMKNHISNFRTKCFGVRCVFASLWADLRKEPTANEQRHRVTASPIRPNNARRCVVVATAARLRWVVDLYCLFHLGGVSGKKLFRW